MAKRGKSKRRRLSADEVRKHSTTTTGGGGNWFTLPDGVDQWAPEKPGRYDINIVPYEVTGNNHPDDVEEGVIWFRHPFKVHHSIGSENKSIICPGTLGKKCPICEEVQRLSKEDYEENEDVIKQLRPQRYVAYNILDPDDDEKISIFAMSVGKFANLLEKELDEGEDPELSNFFDVNEMGKTIRVRFSEASFGGHKYIEATKIDFRDRDEMDEDEILDKTVCLDEIFTVPEYDKLKSMFLQTDEDEDDEDDDPKPRKRKASKKPVETDDDDDDFDEEEEEKPKKKLKRKPAKKKPEPDEDDEGGDVPWDEDDETEEETAKRVSKKKKPEPEEDEDDFDDDDDFDDEEEEEKPKPKSKKKVVKKKPEPEPDEDDDDDFEDDEEEEEKPARKSKAKKKAPAKKKKKPAPEPDEDDFDDDDWDE